MTLDRNQSPITIVICDDDEDDRFLARQTLEAAGLAGDLRFVEDGEQLLNYLYQRAEFSAESGKAPRPGLILLDLHMPKLDGRRTLAIIKGDAMLRDIPVVVLTASAFPEDSERSVRLGANSVIPKPVTLSGFVDAMKSLGPPWRELVASPPGHG